MPTTECKWLLECPFFEDPVGYSPELGTLFVERFCRRDHQACARYIARSVMGRGSMPDDMLPTDFPQLDILLIEWKRAENDG